MSKTFVRSRCRWQSDNGAALIHRLIVAGDDAMAQPADNGKPDPTGRSQLVDRPVARRPLVALLATLPFTAQALGIAAAKAQAGDHDTMPSNLLADLPDASAEEVFETLAEWPGIRLERIVSNGQVTPDGEWYDQEQDEWVMVLAGAARLLIEGDGETALGPGDAVFLPAHKRHRVTWTVTDEPTVWLALHVWPQAE